MPHGTTALLRVTLWLMLALGAVYMITLVPGIGPDGWSPAIDGWLNMTVCALVIVVLVLRTVLDRRDRAAWLCMIAGLVAAFCREHGVSGVLPVRRARPDLSWSDVGYLLFYALLAIGLFLRLRTRARHLPFSLSLDGLIAGLTVAALAETFVPGAEIPLGVDTSSRRRRPTRSPTCCSWPCGRHRRRPRQGRRPSWWLLCASFVAFFLTDTLYADGSPRTYVGGGPTDAGWLLARLLLVAAALVSLRAEGVADGRPRGGQRPRPARPLRPRRPRAPLPRQRGQVSPFASVVALSAGVLMVGRTALTFQELRALTEPVSGPSANASSRPRTTNAPGSPPTSTTTPSRRSPPWTSASGRSATGCATACPRRQPAWTR